jgi:hypothetical protein
MRITWILVIATAVAFGQMGATKAHKVKAEQATFKGKSGMRVTDAETDATEDRLVILTDTNFGDGTIEAEISGEPAAGAGSGARGFVGIAFRVAPDLSKFECFYLRPTNGRADDQVRRNHSAQYVSFPEFPWARLRKESPEMYESYVDLVPGEWTKVKIEVKGNKARLYVHGNAQPTLVVNDLKLGAAAKGQVALWIGPGTLGHFADVRVSK